MEEFGARQSIETRASLNNHGSSEHQLSNEYLKQQLQGMVNLFVSFYDAFYFDLITETEHLDISTYRLAEIGESLMRHG